MLGITIQKTYVKWVRQKTYVKWVRQKQQTKGNSGFE